MNIEVILLIIVVIGLIAGPVMMLRPNPTQKRKESFRLIARQKDIHFSMRKLPQQAADGEAPPPMAVYFFSPVMQDKENDCQACYCA
ncbi:MAG: hypothetical protein EOO68_26780, partial [Moraxellaceae bacterium]